MIRKLNYYNGSTILGYRLSLPKLEKSFYARDIKVIGAKRVGYNNYLDCLRLVKKTCIK